MYSPEENQVAIYLLKANLDTIGNELVAQRTTCPELDAENEQKIRESMNALRSTRILSVEVERLRQDNVRFISKRMQLKRQSEDITKQLEKTREYRTDMETLLNIEDQNIENQVRKYEDTLREKAERFRSSSRYYNEEKMRAEIETVKETLGLLENEVKERQRVIDEKKSQLQTLVAEVPDDILVVLGKLQLENIQTSLGDEIEAAKKQKEQLVSQNDFAPLTFRK